MVMCFLLFITHSIIFTRTHGLGHAGIYSISYPNKGLSLSIIIIHQNNLYPPLSHHLFISVTSLTGKGAITFVAPGLFHKRSTQFPHVRNYTIISFLRENLATLQKLRSTGSTSEDPFLLSPGQSTTTSVHTTCPC